MAGTEEVCELELDERTDEEIEVEILKQVLKQYFGTEQTDEADGVYVGNFACYVDIRLVRCA